MKPSVVYSRKNCRLCESADLELAVPMRASPIGDAYITKEELPLHQDLYPLSLHLCKACGHLQALDVVDPDVLFGNYIYSTSTSPGLVEHFRRYAKAIIEELNCPTGSFVVEMGSNDGSLLRAFKELGMRVLGVDPARAIALKATSQGLETLPTFFSFEIAKKIKEEYGAADIVAANNVFAHADNMIDIVKGIHHLLAREGVFVFEVSYLVDMVEKAVFDTIYHEHVCHHRVEPLQHFFKQHGLELFNVERIATKGGSIRCFAKRIVSTRKVEPIVQDLIQLERKMGFDKIEIYEKFKAHLEAIKATLTRALKKLQSEGKKIIGYGASNPVTTIMYEFELGDYLEFIADDNLIKQGRYSPGYHIPVLSSQAIYEKKPDVILILAWQYADMIMKKHKKFLEEGGCFVVPLPEVRIYDKNGEFSYATG